MTATIATRRLSDSADSLLRCAMRVDATACAGLGLLTATTADPLSRLSGLAASAEWVIGAALVGYGSALYVLAALPAIRRVGLSVMVLNAVAAIAAFTVLTAGVLPLTTAGEAMVVATGAATLGMAYLQYLGVRRLA